MSNQDNRIPEKISEFWLKRWADEDISWHHEEINEHLLNYWNKLGLAPDSPVFVPLCGKSVDMVWLAQQGHTVVGVEISAKAICEFFSEQGMTPNQSDIESFDLSKAEKYNLLCGDIFHLKPEHLQGVKAVYDRASLVALNAKWRARYAQLMAEVLPIGCAVMLVAMDYSEGEMQGPPHSVPDTEVHDLFGANFHITHLHEQDLLKDTARYEKKGLSRLSEHIYMMKRK